MPGFGPKITQPCLDYVMIRGINNLKNNWLEYLSVKIDELSIIDHLIHEDYSMPTIVLVCIVRSKLLTPLSAAILNKMYRPF